MSTFVLVHGAFVDGWYWGGTAARLEEGGHRVLVADLPSTGTDPATLGGLTEDVAAVRGLVESAEEPVVLVGHSYGGVVVTEIADHPGVAHTVYLAAFWPTAGQTVFHMVGELPPDGWIVPTADGSAVGVTDDPAVAREALAADIGPEPFARYHARLMLSSVRAMGQPSTAPDRSHPVTFVVTQRDNAFPTAAQELVATRADRVEQIPTSHTPMLSDPDGLAVLLSRIASPTRTTVPGGGS